MRGNRFKSDCSVASDGENVSLAHCVRHVTAVDVMIWNYLSVSDCGLWRFTACRWISHAGIVRWMSLEIVIRIAW